MTNIRLPFGLDGMELSYDPEKSEILESGIERLKNVAGADEDAIVKTAIENPIGSPKLRELAACKNNCVIIISDYTRPVPSRHIIPFMLDELREGNKDIDITLLVATGSHRLTTIKELVQKLGSDIVAQEKIIFHDSRDGRVNTKAGVLPSGAELVINKLAVTTDLLISEGFIEPHFFAGFSGGSKSVLPGLGSLATVLGNHCSAFLMSPYARAGIIDGNPLQIDIAKAKELAGLAFIVNVILDSDRKVAAAFAGEPMAAHRTGCDFLLDYCRVKPSCPGDIVVVSNGGYPHDQSIYFSTKGLMAAESAAAENAVIIMASACSKGVGSNYFYEAMRNCRSPEALYDEIIATPQDQTKQDQWASQILTRILRSRRVIYVTESGQRKTIEEMKLEWMPDVNCALEAAYADKGRDARLVIIPNGTAIAFDRAGL